jgi:hypothetical protein
MDSGITLKSQEFAGQQQAHGSQYQLQGSEALARGIGQAPGQFQQARQQQVDLARSGVELQEAEIRKQELGEKLMMTQQLRASDMQRLQRDAMAMQNEHAALALEQAKRQMRGEISPSEAFSLAAHAHGEMVTLGDQKANYDPSTRGVTWEPMSAEEKRAQLMRHGHYDELAKMSNDLLIAQIHATIQSNAQLGGGTSDEGKQALAPLLQEAQRRRLDLSSRSAQAAGEKPQAPAPTEQPDQEAQKAIGLPEVYPRLQGTPQFGKFQGMLSTMVREYATKHQLPLDQAGAWTAHFLEDPSHPEVLTKAMQKSGYSREQAIAAVKATLGLSLDQATKAVDQVYQ